jgi:glycerol dehydrogenase
LPVCLEDLRIKFLSDEKLAEISSVACAPDAHMQHMPFQVTQDMVAAAILAADRFGSAYKSQYYNKK